MNKLSSMFAASILVMSAGLSANTNVNVDNSHGYSHAYSENCETSFDAEITFANNQLTVTNRNDQKIQFNGAGMVWVDGKTISLSNEEAKLAQQYYQDIEKSIPMVADIAVEAIDITQLALTEVFTALLGEESELPQLINTKLGGISQSITDHVYQNPNSLTFDSDHFENDIGFDSSLEQEIEDMSEELMSVATGEFLVFIGKMMLSSDGDMDDFERKMESLGSDIETRAEEIASQLEYKAESLCKQFQAIEDTESKLQQVNELKGLDLIRHTGKKA